MQQQIAEWMQYPIFRAVLIMVGAMTAVLVLNAVVIRWILFLVRKTKTDLDDQIVNAVRPALSVSFVLLGLSWSLEAFKIPNEADYVIDGVLKTIAVVVWAVGGMRLGSAILQAVGRHAGKVAVIQPRTLPVFEILVKILVVGGALYFAFLAWNINVTGWRASAGVVGIAVGFAAKDTLANLFAGFFILADAPYKLGDFVVLQNGVRGMVTDIGIRSTRVLTRDDIEIYVPNAVIANSEVINETGGPHDKERIRVKVSVAYGSDVAEVEEVLLRSTEDNENVAREPTPRVRFRTFGADGLDFELLAWVHEPVLRGRTLHQLNTTVYNGLNAAGIEIPFPKRDVYIRQMPDRRE